MNIIQYDESNKGGLPEGTLTEDEYAALLKCSNCGKAVWGIAKKGVELAAVVTQTTCPNCKTFRLQR